MQQDDKDRKNEIVIEGFEDKTKKLEDSLKEKTSCFVQPKAHSSKRVLKMKN
jgi:hypothetical protein